MGFTWDRVKELFAEAAALPSKERAGFLDDQCGGDDALRREVDALLAADDSAGSFMKGPDRPTGPTANAYGQVREVFIDTGGPPAKPASLRFCPRCSGRFSTGDVVCPNDGEVLVEDPESLVDTTIDNLYQVTRLLGRGGFGVVYLARHVLLRDLVAIKVLPRQLSSDTERIERFLREGRAARAISHPNLITVYDLRASRDGLTYMVQEYVDGRTLREELEIRGKLTPIEALDLLEPVASALDEAHAHGIVHRDLKPDNIMVGTSGGKRVVKLLDLGIVKLREILAETPTGGSNVTHPGHIIGTPPYMSPEQWGDTPADGGPDIDGRADVYSFGVLLFEFLSGRQPFRGRSTSEYRRAHLVDPPPMLSESEPKVGVGFSEVLTRAMAKDRKERQETAGQLVRELRAALDAPGKAASTTDQTRRFRAAHATTVEDAAEEVRRPWLRPAAVILGLALLGAGGFAAWKVSQNATPGEPPRKALAGTGQITNTGKATDAAISPDGQRVVSVMHDGATYSLQILHLATKSTMPLGSPSTARLYGVTFSPDGNYVYYVNEPSAGPSVLMRIPIGGTTPQQVLIDIESAVTFSPDAARIAYIRASIEPGERQLVIAAIDGSTTDVLASTTGQQLFAVEGPSWSPDGERIACSIIDTSKGTRGFVATVGLKDRAIRALTHEDWFYAGKVVWAANGSGLVCSAAHDTLGVLQLWSVDYPSGSARLLRVDINSNDGVSMTADGTSLVTIRVSVPTNIYTTDIEGTGKLRQVALGTTRYYGIAWTPDGRLVYSSMANGSPDIWIANADGSGAQSLTFDPGVERDPVMSPDGQTVYFSSNRDGAFNIWRMHADGSAAERLTSGQDDQFPSLTPDGTNIVYQGFENRSPSIWRVGVNGGTPVKIGPAIANWPSVSPDGKSVACFARDAKSLVWGTCVFPLEGSAEPIIVEAPRLSIPRLIWQRVRWSPDSRNLLYLGPDASATQLWSRPIADGAPQALTTFPSETILSFDVRNGVAVYARAAVTSDVVLVTDP